MKCADGCLKNKDQNKSEELFTTCLNQCNCIFQNYHPDELDLNNQTVKFYIKIYLLLVSLALIISFSYLNRNSIRHIYNKQFSNDEQMETLLPKYINNN